MKKLLINLSNLPVGLSILLIPSILSAALPIGFPPPGTAWTITYSEPAQGSRQIKPASPEHAAALDMHRKMTPKLIKSEACRVGDEFFKNDYYGNKSQLQTYITPKMFIEEARSGDEILATSRIVDELREGNVSFLFFPELAYFDKAEPQGEVSSGKYDGMLKYRLSSHEDEANRKMVANHLREQGINIAFDKEEVSEQYIIINPKTKLPAAFFNGSVTAVYEYSLTNQKPALTPAVQKLKATIENP